MSAIYQPLNPERHEIRLLTLHPSPSYNDILQCSLSHTTLDSPGEPEYEALSYVWGPPHFSQQILVDKHPLKITENLECALRHLRQASSPRILWVDAICIDQASTAERSHQVTLMRAIYTHCKCDIAWLGPNPGSFRTESNFKRVAALDAWDYEIYDEDWDDKGLEQSLSKIHHGMRTFRKICQHDMVTLDAMLSYWREYGGKPDYKDSDDDDDDDDDNDDNQATRPVWLLSHDQQTGLLALFRWAPLWSRIWVMQELSCAQRVFLVAGTETLDWNDIASFLDDENRPYADAFHVTGGHTSAFGILASTFGLIQTIQQQRRIMREVEEGKYESRLLDVLARFQYAEASDPRDLIYGLLGLVSEAHPIRPDYHKSIQALSIETTAFFINRDANLDIICQNPWTANGGTGPSQKKTTEIPSWVVDYANNRRLSHLDEGLDALIFAQRGIFSAASPSCSVPCKVSPDGLLHVSGVILDKLLAMPQPEESAYDEVDGAWPQKWPPLYFTDEQLWGIDSARYPATDEPLFRAYWRTLVMDCTSHPIQRLSLDNIEADEKIFTKIMQLDLSTYLTDTPKHLNHLLDRGPSLCSDLISRDMLSRSERHWVFTVSKTGLFLMVDKEAKAGDVLAILDGGKVPCLLRPCQEGSELRYRVINTAYVHGYMDGRAAADVEKGLLRRQEILLA
ncbi:heterokaryon incompatibility protein-domain-containing protein [Xylaria sp. CBS 124048]|nr:heterokaryon incompatibility protein-domain-containing protein [Xylaria sp. CBS 124048]